MNTVGLGGDEGGKIDFVLDGMQRCRTENGSEFDASIVVRCYFYFSEPLDGLKSKSGGIPRL